MADECRSCDQPVVWMVTKKGNRILVNVLPKNLERRAPKYTETEFDAKVHEAHFATCPKADFHRGRGG